MKNKILSLAIAGLLFVSFSSAPVSKAKPAKITNKVLCPLIQLSSPPTTLKVACPRPNCPQTLTVNSNNCTPFTFYFTWAGGSFTKATASGSSVLSFTSCDLTAASGSTITLTITDSGSNSSSPYYFTAQTCP